MAQINKSKKRIRDDGQGADTSTPPLHSKRPKNCETEPRASLQDATATASKYESTAFSDSEEVSQVRGISKCPEETKAEDDENQGVSEASSSCSSDSESSASSDPQIIKLGRPGRPTITPPLPSSSGSQLLARIRAFMPQLQAANEELDGDRLAGRLQERELENVQDGEEYIEMDLGLGVLEERRQEEDSSSSSDGDSDDQGSSKTKGEDSGCAFGADISKPSNGKDTNVLGRLMGQKSRKGTGSKFKIELLDE
ncbi:MAG: hypothetical protein M1829_004193 [Trizodia sp. TS-e1964]|nr:MAG: hypothetical protein M1829_004193 [Trizodia sp. TS-e1964]